MRNLILLFATLAAVSPALARESRQVRGEAALAKEVQGLVPGKPQSCVSLTRIESSHIIGGTAIVYRAFGGTLYVNRPLGADMLRDDDIPVQFLFGSQMCRLDQMKLVDRGSRFEHGFASLGDFVPYTRPKPAN